VGVNLSSLFDVHIFFRAILCWRELTLAVDLNKKIRKLSWKMGRTSRTRRIGTWSVCTRNREEMTARCRCRGLDYVSARVSETNKVGDGAGWMDRWGKGINKQRQLRQGSSLANELIEAARDPDWGNKPLCKVKRINPCFTPG
jgi:hypothetical protein